MIKVLRWAIMNVYETNRNVESLSKEMKEMKNQTEIRKLKNIVNKIF